MRLPILVLHNLRRDIGFAVRRRRNFVPQRFTPACPRWKRICHIDDGHVHSRSVPCVHETPNEQCFRRDSGVLSGDNGMGDRAAQRRGNWHLRLGRASGCIGSWRFHRDLWVRSRKETNALHRWSSRWDVLFPWFRGSALCRGRCSNARARRGFRCTSNRATSLAHVLFAVHRHRVLFPGAATSIPDWLRKTNVLFLPAILPLILMIFWLSRVLFTDAFKRTASRYGTHEDRTALREQSLPG